DISNRIQLGVFLIENGMDNKSINNLISELKITKKETFASYYRELILARIKKGLMIIIKNSYQITYQSK
ncbi:hypothetical protein, partial [Enterobacter hormaechei]|uniref:hypothetical protein n=1 Tax=Enterobacter hormaechei TaxID=158836 RepID=UPI003D700619